MLVVKIRKGVTEEQYLSIVKAFRERKKGSDIYFREDGLVKEVLVFTPDDG